jgi:hypothetical protein
MYALAACPANTAFLYFSTHWQFGRPSLTAKVLIGILSAATRPSLQYPRPEFVAADLSKVKLADALAATSFDPTKTTLFTAGEGHWPTSSKL